MLEVLLKSLTDELKLELPKKDPTGFYALALDPEAEIKVKELDPGLVFCAKIGQCPQTRREVLFTHLMKANFLGQGTGGASIGLDEGGNTLTLSLVLPYDMNYKTFRDALEDFVNYRDFWKGELVRHESTL